MTPACWARPLDDRRGARDPARHRRTADRCHGPATRARSSSCTPRERPGGRRAACSPTGAGWPRPPTPCTASASRPGTGCSRHCRCSTSRGTARRSPTWPWAGRSCSPPAPGWTRPGRWSASTASRWRSSRPVRAGRCGIRRPGRYAWCTAWRASNAPRPSACSPSWAVTIRGVYGSTEAGNFVTVSTLAGELERPGTIGRPLPAFDLEIAAPPGGAGELLVRGPSMMAGLRRSPARPGRASRRPAAHRRPRTPRRRRVPLLRRPAKDMIKTGGENVYSAEVERVLLAASGGRRRRRPGRARPAVGRGGEGGRGRSGRR